MTDSAPHRGLPAADLRALDDLRARKDSIGAQLDDETLPAHVRGRLLTEFRKYVEAILEIERKRPEPAGRTTLDELRERRAERRRAVSGDG